MARSRKSFISVKACDPVKSVKDRLEALQKAAKKTAQQKKRKKIVRCGSAVSIVVVDKVDPYVSKFSTCVSACGVVYIKRRRKEKSGGPIF